MSDELVAAAEICNVLYPELAYGDNEEFVGCIFEILASTPDTVESSRPERTLPEKVNPSSTTKSTPSTTTLPRTTATKIPNTKPIRVTVTITGASRLFPSFVDIDEPSLPNPPIIEYINESDSCYGRNRLQHLGYDSYIALVVGGEQVSASWFGDGSYEVLQPFGEAELGVGRCEFRWNNIEIPTRRGSVDLFINNDLIGTYSVDEISDAGWRIDAVVP